MKMYLMPRNFRRGNPVLMFVDKREFGYELGCYHMLRPRLKEGPYSGEGWEYDAVSATTISKELFEAFKKEAKFNYKKYEDKKK